MAKVKFFDLEGTPLDWAVSKIQGIEVEISEGRLLTGEKRYEGNSSEDTYGCEFDVEFNPTSDPIAVSAIIDAEKIGTEFYGNTWVARHPRSSQKLNSPDRSVAVLRAYVGMHILELTQNAPWIEIPDELIESNSNTERQRG